MFSSKVTPELREKISKICLNGLMDMMKELLKELGKEEDFDKVLDNFAGARGISGSHASTCKWLEKVFAAYLNAEGAIVTESAEDNKRVLTVASVPYSRFMNEVARKLVDRFNDSGENLKLIVRDDYKDRDIEDILDEGMYDYQCSDNQLIEMLYEMAELASPVGWTTEDILHDTSK